MEEAEKSAPIDGVPNLTPNMEEDEKSAPIPELSRVIDGVPDPPLNIEEVKKSALIPGLSGVVDGVPDTPRNLEKGEKSDPISDLSGLDHTSNMEGDKSDPIDDSSSVVDGAADPTRNKEEGEKLDPISDPPDAIDGMPDPTPLLGRKRKIPTVQNENSSNKRLKAQHDKMGKMKTLRHFRGRKMSEVCSQAKGVFRMADGKFDMWGLVYIATEGLHLWVSHASCTQILRGCSIVGSKFEKNLGHKDFQEGLIFLLEEGEEKICLCMNRMQYEWFDQYEVDKDEWRNDEDNIHVDWKDYPEAPFLENINGEVLSQYISSILKWAPESYVEVFSIGRKGSVNAGNEYDATQMPKVLLPENVEDLWEKIKGKYDPVNIFKNRLFTIPISRCHIAPQDVKCRDWDPDYSQELKRSFASFSALHFHKRICFLIPVEWDETNTSEKYFGKAFAHQPSTSDIEKCHFWIIGGQHIVMAYKYLVDDEKTRPELKNICHSIDAAMFWAPFTLENNLLMMDLSLALNAHHKIKMENSQLLCIAKQMRDIYQKWGRPKNTSGNAKDSKWKLFCSAAKIVVVWQREATSIKWRELAPFLFKMSDTTFDRWMQVYERSRTGSLIALNASLQHEVEDRAKNREAWHFPRKQARAMEGLEDEVLLKIANCFLEKKKIALKDDDPKKKSYKPDQAGKWLGLESYCHKKKSHRGLQILLLYYLAREHLSDIRGLTYIARKERFKNMMRLYHLDKGKLDLFADALGEDALMDVNNKSIAIDNIDLHPSLTSLVEITKASVDVTGTLNICRVDDRIVLRSLTGLHQEEFHQNLRLDPTLINKVHFMFLDITVIPNEGPFDYEFFRMFFQTTIHIGWKTSHVVVIISEAFEATLAVRAMFEISGYIPIFSQYVMKPKSWDETYRLHRTDGKVAYTVTYAIFKESFVNSNDKATIMGSIVGGFKSSGAFSNYEDNIEDEASRTIPFEKSMTFFSNVCGLFLQYKNNSIVFGDGTNILVSLLNLGVHVHAYSSDSRHQKIMATLNKLFTTVEQVTLDKDREVVVTLLKRAVKRQKTVAAVCEILQDHLDDKNLAQSDIDAVLKEYCLSSEDQSAHDVYALPDPLPCGPLKREGPILITGEGLQRVHNNNEEEPSDHIQIKHAHDQEGDLDKGEQHLQLTTNMEINNTNIKDRADFFDSCRKDLEDAGYSEAEIEEAKKHHIMSKQRLLVEQDQHQWKVDLVNDYANYASEKYGMLQNGMQTKHPSIEENDILISPHKHVLKVGENLETSHNRSETFVNEDIREIQVILEVENITMMEMEKKVPNTLDQKDVEHILEENFDVPMQVEERKDIEEEKLDNSMVHLETNLSNTTRKPVLRKLFESSDLCQPIQTHDNVEKKRKEIPNTIFELQSKIGTLGEKVEETHPLKKQKRQKVDGDRMDESEIEDIEGCITAIQELYPAPFSKLDSSQIMQIQNKATISNDSQSQVQIHRKQRSKGKGNSAPSKVIHSSNKKSTRKLLILDVHNVLLRSIPAIRHLKMGIRIGKNNVTIRPYLHEFLIFCFSRFDVGIWSCLVQNELDHLLELTLGEEERSKLKFSFGKELIQHCGYLKNSDKPILLKPLGLIMKKYPQYCPQNLVLLETLPYRSSINPFYASLYPRTFMANLDDSFLKDILIPYLTKIVESKDSVHQTIKQNYPSWSKRSLKLDWEINKDIWESLIVQNLDDAQHLTRFQEQHYIQEERKCFSDGSSMQFLGGGRDTYSTASSTQKSNWLKH